MKSIPARLTVFLAIGAVCMGFGFGQVLQTGSLTGIVVDSENQPLPGVAVSITSPQLITPQVSAVTTSKGFFRFSYLPPGTYKASLSLQGFSPYVQENIVVRVGDVTEIRVKMSQAAIEETISVTAAPPVVSLASTKTSVSITKEDLMHLPMSRDLGGVMQLAPGVTASGSAFGSSAKANSYNVDGVHVNDPKSSTNAANSSLDIYDEIQIETTGHSAEYGYASGAVLNAIMKSGGNVFSGDASFYYTNKSLQADNWTKKGLEAPPEEVQYAYEVNLTLGGPIVKNKVWFFGALGYAPTSTNVEGFSITDIKQQLFAPAFRLTAQPGKAHRLSLSMTYGRITNPYLGASYNVTPETTFDLAMNRFTGVVNWLWTLSKNSTLEVRGAVYTNPMDQISNGGTEPLVWNIPENTITGGFPSTESLVKRYLSSVNLTRYVDNFGGDHMFKAGFEYEMSQVDNRSIYPVDEYGMSNYTILVPDVAVYAFKYIPTEGTGRLSRYTQYSGYLQDSWRINRYINLNAGLRASFMDLWIPVQTNVEEQIPIANWTDLEPRLALAIDPFGDGKTAIKAGFNKYTTAMYVWYDQFNPNMPTIEYYMQTAPGEFTGPIFVQSPEIQPYVAPDLKRPHVYEYTLGVSRNMGSNWKIEGLFVAKRLRDFITGELDDQYLQFYTPIEVENPLGGTLPAYDQGEGFPTQPAGYFDNNPYAYVDYDAVILGVEKRFRGGSMFRANYTWSKAFGTANQDGDPLQASAQSGGFMWWNDPNTTATGYTEGYLEEDRTHQIKVQGIAMLPLGFSLSCNYIGSSGTPYTRSFYYPMSVLGVTRFLAEPRGDQRYPFVHYLDLRIEKSFAVFKQTLRIFADVFNPFNFNATLSTQNILETSDYGKITAIQSPAYIRFGFRLTY